MYEITIIMTAREEASDLNISSKGSEHVVDHFDPIVNFWNECINENLILNLCVVNADTWPDVSIYYSISEEAAQAFVDKFQNLEADFSMRKFWSLIHFDTQASINTCDFENVWAVPIVSEDGTVLWSAFIQQV